MQTTQGGEKMEEIAALIQALMPFDAAQNPWKIVSLDGWIEEQLLLLLRIRKVF